MEINYKALSEKLRKIDRRTELIQYIFKCQGGDLARLDFNAAALEIGADRKTVRNYVTQLGRLGVIEFEGDGLRLSQNILTGAI